jgi:C4-type Zn-finger protein
MKWQINGHSVTFFVYFGKLRVDKCFCHSCDFRDCDFLVTDLAGPTMLTTATGSFMLFRISIASGNTLQWSKVC